MTKEITWGLISKSDSETIMKTLNLVCEREDADFVHVTEIGIFDGGTSRGIYDYLESKGKAAMFTAIDNWKDKEVVKPLEYCNFIKGDSTEVYSRIPDNSQHFIFIDGDHSLIGVIADFYAYADKVKDGGFMAFHDTGKHIKAYKDFQHGEKDNPDAYISVRKALKKIGLLNNRVSGWRLVFDEADENNEAGGVCVFKKFRLWE